MMKMNESMRNGFDKILREALASPMVAVDRSTFLRNVLSKCCAEEQIECAIQSNPAQAGIRIETINKIADDCITKETLEVTAMSALTGIPGGLALLGTVPADLVQYLIHMVVMVQKLAYLYGWSELSQNKDEMDDETRELVLLFLGVMFGVDGAVKAIQKISDKIALKLVEKAGEEIAQKVLVKNIAISVTKKMSFKVAEKVAGQTAAKTISKIVPFVGAAASGGISYASFTKCSKRLQKHLGELDLCKVEFYLAQTA